MSTSARGPPCLYKPTALQSNRIILGNHKAICYLIIRVFSAAAKDTCTACTPPSSKLLTHPLQRVCRVARRVGPHTSTRRKRQRSLAPCSGSRRQPPQHAELSRSSAFRWCLAPTAAYNPRKEMGADNGAAHRTASTSHSPMCLYACETLAFEHGRTQQWVIGF